MSRPRDSQRSKLYTAERVLSWHERNKRYADIHETRARVDAIWKSSFIKKLVGTYKHPALNRVQVSDGRGRRRAYAYGGHKIALPVWARTDATILHELAHIVCHKIYGLDEVAPHGREFAAVQLRLVRRFMGKDAHDALRASFKEHRVKYSKRKSLSRERLAHLREQGRQLAAARWRQQ